MKCEAQRKCREDHVHQTEIQDSPWVSIGCPRVGKEEDRRQYARGSDRIANVKSSPSELPPCSDRIARRLRMVPTIHRPAATSDMVPRRADASGRKSSGRARGRPRAVSAGVASVGGRMSFATGITDPSV